MVRDTAGVALARRGTGLREVADTGSRSVNGPAGMAGGMGRGGSEDGWPCATGDAGEGTAGSGAAGVEADTAVLSIGTVGFAEEPGTVAFAAGNMPTSDNVRFAKLLQAVVASSEACKPS